MSKSFAGIVTSRLLIKISCSRFALGAAIGTAVFATTFGVTIIGPKKVGTIGCVIKGTHG